MLFANTDIVVAPVVLAVRVASNAAGDKVLGIATADATSRRFGVCELPLTDTLADLEVRRGAEAGAHVARSHGGAKGTAGSAPFDYAQQSLVVQLGVRECLLPDDAEQVELRKVRSVIERCGVTVTTQKKGEPTAPCRGAKARGEALTWRFDR